MIKELLAFIAGLIAVIIGTIHLVIWLSTPSPERQQEINNFAAKYNCAPEGYVGTRNRVERTYRCDNGLFIVWDMREPK